MIRNWIINILKQKQLPTGRSVLQNMKKLKTVPAIVMVVVLVIASPLSTVHAEKAVLSYELEADKLKSLNLFKGTDIGYELERTANRIEAGIMLVRLLGKESEALGGQFEHPFTDVPDWAGKYVGYMYENGLTKGISDDLFAPFMVIDAKSYITFLLRALGYSEETEDFTWQESVENAHQMGILSSVERAELENQEFNRGLMAAMSYNAVNTVLKDEKFTLAVKLAKAESIPETMLQKGYFKEGISPEKLYLPYLKKDEYLPYIKGLDIKTALIELRKAGANSVFIEYKYDEIVEQGIVLSQDYTPYLESTKDFECTVMVSRGPSPLYHKELLEICEKKDWDEEGIPYVISAAKYIIKNTGLNKYQVFNKLANNVSEIKIQKPEVSAKMSYAAVYDTATGYLSVNRYLLSERLVLHEIVHALSKTSIDNKIGFHEKGINNRKVTEAYTAYIADSSMQKFNGVINSFNAGEEEILFGGGIYSCEGPDNFILGVYEPLFLLAGESNIESMFFGDLYKYNNEILNFNEKYGENKWSELWKLAENFISSQENKTIEERKKMAKDYFSYLDLILECLWIDLEYAQEDLNLLSAFEEKLANIKRAFPLNNNDYRNKIADIENVLFKEYSKQGVNKTMVRPGYWKVPDFHGMSSIEVYNILAIEAASVANGYRVVQSNLEQGLCEGVLYKNPNNPEMQPVLLKPGEQIKLGSEYIIMIPGMQITEGYTVMRDIVSDFGKYLADYNDLGNYVVGRVLEGEGLSYRYKFNHFDSVNSLMQGRIVGQFPSAGTAVIPGKTIIVIEMLREYQ